ncbi:MAG: hypothetical protein GY760_21860 [Deltaproteobacteria bacterium]|nr:hypothetical protein [Deltaproteobacteria bacterium]
MNKKNILILTISFFTILLSGCEKKKVVIDEFHQPEGFAVYQSNYQNRSPNRAISSDGVVYRIRKQRNDPVAKLSFWKEALKKRMIDTGYFFVRESNISTEKQKGYLLELTAPYGEQDYSYMIGIFVKGDEIVIAEATGEILRFKKHRKQIIAAIKKIK